MKRDLVRGLLALSVASCILAMFVATDYRVFHDKFDEIYISIIAGYASNVLFFAAVGLLLFLFSLRRPENETLDSRIRFLFSSRDLPSAFIEYCKAQVHRMAGACTYVTKNIIVMDRDDKSNSYKVFVEYTYRIRNLFRDDICEDRFFIFVSPDKIADLKIQGEVLECSLTVKDRVDRYVSQPVSIIDDFEREIHLRLAPNEEAEVHWRFWIWMAIGQEHYTEQRRYVERFTLMIENMTHNTIFISDNSKLTPRIGIKKGDKIVLFEKINMTPLDIHRFWWA